MKIIVEVVADDRDDAVNLLREAASKLKRRSEECGKEINHCIGDYRVTVSDEDPS